MAKARVKLDFIRLPIPAKIEFVRDRVVDMTGNANFPTPDVPLTTLTTAVDDLETKHLAAQGGGAAQIQAQDESEEALDDLMREEAGYVTRVADGSTVIITSAGFAFTQTEPSPVAIPAKVEKLKLTHSDEAGTILTNCEVVENARGYVTVITDIQNAPLTVDTGSVVFQMAATPSPLAAPPSPVPSAGFVLFNADTFRKTIFKGLKSGTRYYVFKYAFNAQGKGTNSSVDSIVAP